VSQKFVETTSTVKKTGGVWKVVLATPGMGAKGQRYSREILEEQGVAAFPKGTKSWISHKAIENRDPRDRFGVFRTDAWYDDSLDKAIYPDGALVSELEISPRYKDLAEEFGDTAALSIFVDGDVDDDGNVVSMWNAEDTSVDLVAAAGLRGSGLLEKISESFVSGSTADQSAQKKDEMEKEFKELADQFAALKAAVESLVTAKAAELSAEAEAEATAKVEAEVEAQVDAVLGQYDEQIALIDAEPELLKSQVESLRSAARKGEDVKPLIQSAKAIVAEARQKLAQGFVAPAVRINENGSTEVTAASFQTSFYFPEGDK